MLHLTVMKQTRINKPKKSKDVPVTQSMLNEFKEELREMFKSFAKEIKSEIHGLRSEVHGLKSEVHSLRSEIHGLKSEDQSIRSQVVKIESNTHSLKAEVHRLGLLIEEQNARNIIVLDGYQQIYHSQQELMGRMSGLEKEWYDFKKTS